MGPMARRGRPTNPRTTELGRYIEERRHERGWSVLDLAHAADVPHNTVSKLELGLYRPRKPDILLRLAKTLDVYPDRLLLRAALTPFLRQPSTPPPPEPPPLESRLLCQSPARNVDCLSIISIFCDLWPL